MAALLTPQRRTRGCASGDNTSRNTRARAGAGQAAATGTPAKRRSQYVPAGNTTARPASLRLVLRLRDLCDRTGAEADSALAAGLQRLSARVDEAVRWTW